MCRRARVADTQHVSHAASRAATTSPWSSTTNLILLHDTLNSYVRRGCLGGTGSAAVIYDRRGASASRTST